MQTERAIAINTGFTETDRKHIANALERVLADTYMLYLKTQYFHWNVVGPMFQPLHQFFEEQYQELQDAVDEIAERIRALGYPAPGTFREFSRLTSIKEETALPDAMGMIRILLEGHETAIRTIRELIPLCNKADDDATDDLVSQRLAAHEKAAWMLRSFLQ
ncbi:MAG TPA: Dps family protein [Oculatellaceae cyanobacterium]|jgi:starvation-inducible DNA-binding protein